MIGGLMRANVSSCSNTVHKICQSDRAKVKMRYFISNTLLCEAKACK